MNAPPGSWARFTLAVLLTPLTLLIPVFALELYALRNISSESFGTFTFGYMATHLARAFLVLWGLVSAMLLVMGLVLRRFRKTRTRHHVLAWMGTMLLVNGSLSVIDAVANEILLPEAVAVENPYCTGWVLYDSLRFVAIVLLFTIPALVFKWCAYGRSAAPAVPEPVWRALGRLYAASLPLAALYLALQRLGIVPDTSNLWC